jgi:hypothetical protein
MDANVGFDLGVFVRPARRSRRRTVASSTTRGAHPAWVGSRARSLARHAAGGALAMAALTVLLLLVVEVVIARAAQPDGPLAARVAVALARLDLGALPLMVGFGSLGGVAAWVSGTRRPLC